MWSGENPQARWLFTSRRHVSGSSTGVYENFNIATHVGDEPHNVRCNREILGAEFATQPENIVWPELTHSTTALEIVSADQDIVPADILFTTNPHVALTTLSADCVPLIAIAHDQQFILTAHIGWRGAADNIASVITSIFEQNTNGNITILLGPAICGDCYHVDPSRIHEVTRVLEASNESGRGLDLRQGLYHYFSDLGYSVNLIGPCTYEAENLFSYRRDQTTGRQAALVKLQ